MAICKEKICIVITQGHWGGAQRYVFDLVEETLKEYDCTVAIGTSYASNDLLERLQQKYGNTQGLRMIELRHLQRAINPMQDMRAVFELRALLKKEKPSLVHYNSAKATVIGSFAALGLAIKRIATIHGWTSLEPLSTLRRWMYQLLEYWSCRLLDALIVPDTVSGTVAIEKYGCAPEKVFLIPHTIDAPNFLPRVAAREALQTHAAIPSSTLWIGTIANLYKTKNIPLLISSFESVRERTQKNISLIIIGDGPERKTIEARINASSAKNHIFLLGSIPDAARLLTAYDVFALTSVKEGYPYVLLEARAAGIPIVATAVGSCAAILDGYQAGACVAPTEETVTTALEQALEHKSTPSTPSPAAKKQDKTVMLYRILLGKQ